MILRSLSLVLLASAAAFAQDRAIPDANTLMKEAVANQHKLDAVRENYTYKESITTEDVDGKGAVKKTEHEEFEVFFVHGHEIQRKVAKEGKPLAGNDLAKENDRVTKQIDKAEKTPPDKSMEGPQSIGISRMLELMEISNPRIEQLRGRAAYAYDFAGKRKAETHGMVEDVSKKLAGTIWIDVADHQVAQVDAHFLDSYHMGAGLLATIQKGTSFHIEQALVSGAEKDALWLPTAADFRMEARLLLLKGIREHVTVRDHDYQRFHVETEQKGSVQQ